MTESTLPQLFSSIRLLALDSDGVLTDGGVYMSADGQQMRRFNIKDGLGIKRVMQNGIIVVIISASRVPIVELRAEQLGIEHVYLDVKNKLEKLTQICQEFNIELDNVAYVGDDLTDIACIRAVGIGATPADGAKDVRVIARHVLKNSGGHGAVREICDLIIEYQGAN